MAAGYGNVRSSKLGGKLGTNCDTSITSPGHLTSCRARLQYSLRYNTSQGVLHAIFVLRHNSDLRWRSTHCDFRRHWRASPRTLRTAEIVWTARFHCMDVRHSIRGPCYSGGLLCSEDLGFAQTYTQKIPIED